MNQSSNNSKNNMVSTHYRTNIVTINSDSTTRNDIHKY